MNYSLLYQVNKYHKCIKTGFTETNNKSFIRKNRDSILCIMQFTLHSCLSQKLSLPSKISHRLGHPDVEISQSTSTPALAHAGVGGVGEDGGNGRGPVGRGCRMLGWRQRWLCRRWRRWGRWGSWVVEGGVVCTRREAGVGRVHVPIVVLMKGILIRHIR